MARTKGSKNRKTVEWELSQKGIVGDFTKLTYEELVAKLEVKPVPAPTAPLPEPVEKSIIDPIQARAIIDDTRRRFGIMVKYFTSEEANPFLIPERIQEWLRLKVFMASTVEEAQECAKKALDKLYIHLSVEWGNKHITGPATTRNIATRAGRALKWADRLDDLGRHEDAARQREKAEIIRQTPPQVGTPWTA